MRRYASRLIQCALLMELFCLGGLAEKRLRPIKKPQPAPIMDEKELIRRFDAHVQEYVKLLNQQEATLPKLKPAGSAQEIKAHQNALAERLQTVRKKAQAGDMFTPEVKQYFITQVHKEFHGPVGREVRATITQGEPLKGHLNVNQPYPEGIPLTTVPPNLLLGLPKLPKELRYGIVGRDLIILDLKANLVVDFIAEAIPSS